MAAVDTSEDNQVAVFNVEQGMCVAVAKGDRSQIVEISFGSDSLLATAGVGHLSFWNVDKGLSSKSAVWGKQADRNLACVAFHGDKALTGTASGQLLSWSPEGTCSNPGSPPLHQGVLEAIRVTKSHVLTGGRDQVLKILDASNLNMIFSISLADCGSVNGQPRAIDLDLAETSLVVGTFGCEIYQIPIQPDKLATGEPKALIQGHHAPKVKDTNEVWGLCTIPGTDRYITVSDDATLRVWGAESKELVALVDLNRHHDRRPLPPDP